MSEHHLRTEDGRTLAYSRLGGSAPGIVFLGGFRSDMTGTKATFLEGWAKERGHAFLRFDYTGHGASSGEFLDGCIGDWARDAADAVQSLTEGPQILVGSSMGGWIALLLARRIPERVAGLVGIAAAPDFTEDSMFAGFSDRQRAALEKDGFVDLPSDYSDDPYRITRKLIEDGRKHLLLRDALPLGMPVRLLHGTEDADVPVSVATRIVAAASGPDIRLTLVKNSDHRFSEPGDLALLSETLGDVIERSGAPRDMQA